MVLVLNYHHQPHPVLHTFKVIASPAYSHMGMYEIFNPVDYCNALELASSTQLGTEIILVVRRLD